MTKTNEYRFAHTVFVIGLGILTSSEVALTDKTDSAALAICLTPSELVLNDSDRLMKIGVDGSSLVTAAEIAFEATSMDGASASSSKISIQSASALMPSLIILMCERSIFINLLNVERLFA